MLEILMNIIIYTIGVIYIIFGIKTIFYDLPKALYQIFKTPYPANPDDDDNNSNIRSDFIDYM